MTTQLASQVPTFPIDVAPAAPAPLVLGHVHTQFPTSFDGDDPEVDYWSTDYLDPAGEGGKHASYGGFVADRPLTSDDAGTDEWSELDDVRVEVQQMRAVAMHGATLDLLSIAATSYHVRRQRQWLQASAEAGQLVQLMPDMFVLAAKVTPAQLAAHVLDLGRSPSAHRLADGRLVVSPFKAEAWTPEQWRTFITAAGGPTKIALVPVLVDWPGKLAAYAAIAGVHGLSVWGDRTPAAYARMVDAGRQVKALGKLWMAPVAVQDVRRRDRKWWEAANTATLRATCRAAIDSGAQWWQVTTWNDYGEGSGVAPSVRHRWAFLFVLAWFIALATRKTEPQIVRDGVVLSARRHLVGVRPTAQTALAVQQSSTSQPAVDQVEALVYATAAAQLILEVGGKRTTHEVAAGPNVVVVPAAVGQVSARLVRAGAEVVRADLEPIVANPAREDLTYGAVLAVATGSADEVAVLRARVADLEQQLEQVGDERDLLRTDRDARVRGLADARAALATATDNARLERERNTAALAKARDTVAALGG